MNSIHNNGENDKSLNEGMEQLDQAYAQLPDDQPPELLDQAILNSAHRAVEKKPHWMQFGWLHGLTTAAVVVLALSLVFNQREQVPSFENEIKFDEKARLRREKTEKKQTPVKQADEPTLGLKEKRGNRRDANQVAPVAAAPQSEAMEIAVEEQAMEPTADAGRAVYASKIQQAKPDSTDKDTSGNEPMPGEQLSDDAALASDTLEFEVISKQSRPATVHTGLAEEVDELTEMDAEIEQQLQEIILLKQSGDKAWETELELFKENHPDYPLPKELSD